MTNQLIKISDNCWKHTHVYGSIFYTKTSDPESERHREDGPAVEYTNGRKEWWVNGKLHRTDGPACQYSNGTKKWYINGKLHREDGPAVETVNGDKEWYINGKRNREDGPAVEFVNGDKFWHFHGKRINVSSQEEFEIYLKNQIFI